MNTTKFDFFSYFKILLTWFFCYTFQTDYGGALIFFFSDEKSYLGATKEMFIHLCDSRHTHKQETKLWG